ncbi:MAG: hypothetical protein OEO77_03585 [Acidimicrobiia bacterium]|nr:hypothetical protein [Acidimicrobiia bacterium]
MAVLMSRREGDSLIVKHHYPLADKIFALIRIAIGWTFLWAFIDKTFGLGFTTASNQAWVDGISPTRNFLEFETSGPFADLFQGLAGQAWVDWLFMVGILGVGLALILGIGMKIAAITGAVLLALMYLAAFQPADNPVTDHHLIYALVLGALALSDAGDTWGFGTAWKRTNLVHRFPFLV